MAAAPARRPSVRRPAGSPSERILTGSDLPWLGAAVLLAVAVRVAWVAYVNVDPTDGRFDDSLFYYRVAQLVSQTGDYLDPYGRGLTAQWPPAYPVALGALYKLFGVHLLLAKALNIALAVGTVGLAYIAARRVFDRRVAFLGALLLALFPGQVYFSTLVYAETMFGLVFMLVLVLALLWTVGQPDAPWWRILLIGLVVGAAGMVRAEGVFLVFVLVAFWALTVRPWRTLGRYTVLLALGTALALTPWTVRNAVQFHQFIPLRADANTAVARTLDPEFENPQDSETKTVGDAIRTLAPRPWLVLESFDERVQKLYENDAGGIRLIQRPARRGFDGEYEKPLSESDAEFWRGLADRYFFALGAAALMASAVYTLRWNRGSLLFIMAALGWTVVFGVLNPATRYHFPLGPLVAIMGAAFIVLVWDHASVAARRAALTLRNGRTRSRDARDSGERVA